MKNSNLHKARIAKNDEFYTQLTDIEKELKHYKKFFKNKTVYCNCDDPEWSNFFKFFALKFEELGLKKFIATSYNADGRGKLLIVERDASGDDKIDINDLEVAELEGDGDFRSPECLALLAEADIVVTNPPFSLFREFISLLMEHKKKFLVVGNNNALTYKEVFKFIKDNRLWLGVGANKTMEFRLPDNYLKWNRIDEKGNKYGKVPAISWFTNLNHKKRKEELVLYKKYTKKEYPKYDNYDAIEVSKVAEIPVDYKGVMGVPVTFLSKYCPEQFEIQGTRRWFYDESLGITKGKTIVNGKETYDRIFIKRREK